jgi:hypothetical protein
MLTASISIFIRLAYPPHTRMTVVMPPLRHAPAQRSHNKPSCFPDITVRCCTRLAWTSPPSTARRPSQTQSPPTTKTPPPRRRRRDTRPRLTLPCTAKLRFDPIPSTTTAVVVSSSKHKADSLLLDDDPHGEGSWSPLSRRKKCKENAVVATPAYCQVCILRLVTPGVLLTRSVHSTDVGNSEKQPTSAFVD